MAAILIYIYGSRAEKNFAHALLVTVSPAITSYSNEPL